MRKARPSSGFSTRRPLTTSTFSRKANMAASQSILDALSALNDHLVETDALATTFSDLAGIDSNAPGWPFVVERHLARIMAAAEALEVLVRREAIPRLQDMEAVHHG
jgi:hypothetical protein